MNKKYGKGAKKFKDINMYPWKDKGYTRYQYMEVFFYNTLVRLYKVRGGMGTHCYLTFDRDNSYYLTFRHLWVQDLRSMNES